MSWPGLDIAQKSRWEMGTLFTLISPLWCVLMIWFLLRFSKTSWNSLKFSLSFQILWNSKAAFTIAFFAAVDHDYDHKQRTLKHRNTQNGLKSTNHKSQTMTFWTRWRKVLFPKRSTEMIDGSEKRKRRWLLNFGIRVSLKSAVTDFRFNGSVLVFNRFQCNKDWVLQSSRRIVCGSWTKWSGLKM